MSNSSLAKEKYPAYSGNYTKGRNTKISEICIHHMAGVLTAKQCGAIFQRKGRNGSSNYGIGKNGEIAVYVDECDTAWCNSNWASNCRSVSIETSNDKTGGNWTVSNKTLTSLIKLVADIAKRNNMGTLVKGKNVTWHSMYANTNCPGKYLLSKMDYIVSEANKINKTPSPTPSGFLPARGYFQKGDGGNNVKKICTFFANKVKGDYFGDYAEACTKTFQKQNGLEQDGCIGKITLGKLGVKATLPKRGYFQKGDSGSAVKKINDCLSKKVEGNYFGDYLQTCVKIFQKQNGLEQDCCIGAITLKKMEQNGFKH